MRVTAVIVSLALCAAGSDWAQAAPEPDDAYRCVDSNGHDRCAQAIREAFGEFDLPPAERLTGQPGRILRVLVVRHELSPALIVTVYGREQARAEVVRPRERRSALAPIPVGRLSPATAAKADALVRLVRRLEPGDSNPTRPTEDGELMICVSHASTGFELVEAGAVTRRTPPGCSRDGSTEAAYELARSVLLELPQCRPLAERFRRWPFDGLDVCASLEGETSAAARVWLRTDELRLFTDGDADRVPSTDFFAPAARLITADGVHQGAEAVPAAWRRLEWYRPLRTRAEPGGAASVEGYLERSVEEDLGGGLKRLKAFERAPFRQSWRKSGGRWRLEEMKVEPFSIHRQFGDTQPAYREIPFNPEKKRPASGASEEKRTAPGP